MRVLIVPAGAAHGGELSDEELVELYAVPATPWLRANMVATLDGAAVGSNGLTGSINNATDKRVFHLLRRLAEVIVVGAGTARAEDYSIGVRPIVVVSRRGFVPPSLEGSPGGSVLMATCASAAGLNASCRALGQENVMVLGDEVVDLTGLRRELVTRGMTNLLCEGGPQLLADLLSIGLVDELCLTQVPAVVGGLQTRIASGPALERSMDLRLLLEEDGTLLSRWFTVR
jgi:riboflavin biosynthesis pyrimidine reductase